MSPDTATLLKLFPSATSILASALSLNVRSPPKVRALPTVRLPATAVIELETVEF